MLIKKWTRQGDEMLAGEKTYYYCGPANKYRNVFSCILFCSLGQEAINCSEIPLDLRDCIPELTELWYTLQKGETMKKLIKKTATITKKQVEPIVTKSIKPTIPQVNNGDFQMVIKGIVEALDNRMNPIKELLQGNSLALTKILTAITDLSKGTSLLLKGLDETRNTIVALKKMVESGEVEEEEQEEEQEEEKEKKQGRPPAGKMTITDALLEIAAENDVNTDNGEMFDDSAFDELFKLVCEKTDHVHQKAFVKTKARELKLIS